MSSESVSSVPLRPAVAAAARRLTEAGIASARTDAEELAAHVLGVERRDLVRYTELDAEAYCRLVEARATRTPLQHLTGVAHFRHVTLAVGPGVFVPRPETEVMVGQVVDAARALPAGAVAVDLCTGSGAIALSLATEVPGLTVHAVELDAGALAWARRNLAGSGVLLHAGDAADALPDLNSRVDLVVSNPPYIPLTAWETVAVEARDHDPALALWGGGADGLDVLRAVERTAARLLRAGGQVAVEHADVQGQAVVDIFARTGRWAAVRGHRDLTARDRFVTATRA